MPFTKTYPKIYGDFICTHCKGRTDYIEWYVEGNEQHYETDCRCGGELDNAVECVYCGDVFAECLAYRDEDGEIACEKCYRKIEEGEELPETA